MAILDSLKKLGRKMTGSPVQGTDIESAIDSIANNYSGGGGNILVVKFTQNDEGDVVCDKAYSEIKAAFESHLPIVGYNGLDLLTTVDDILSGTVLVYSFGGAFHFGYTDSTITGIETYTYSVLPDDTVVEEDYEKTF